VTFENDFLSPAKGGLEDTVEFPRAEQNTYKNYIYNGTTLSKYYTPYSTKLYINCCK